MQQITFQETFSDETARFQSGVPTGETTSDQRLLLRSCQLGIVIGGAALIALGCGATADWLRPLALCAAGGALAGLVYQSRQRRRGRDEGLLAFALPVAGMLSGLFTLLVQA